MRAYHLVPSGLEGGSPNLGPVFFLMSVFIRGNQMKRWEECAFAEPEVVRSDGWRLYRNVDGFSGFRFLRCRAKGRLDQWGNNVGSGGIALHGDSVNLRPVLIAQ